MPISMAPPGNASAIAASSSSLAPISWIVAMAAARSAPSLRK
jgi:hypothetical protein